MTDEARRLGLVLDQETGEAAERFNDNLTRIKALLQGGTNEVVRQSIGWLERLSQTFYEGAAEASGFASTATVVNTALKLLVSSGIIVKNVFDALGAAIGSAAAALVLAAQGEFRQAWDALSMGGTDMVAQIKEAAAGLGAVWSESAAKAEAAGKRTSDAAKKVKPPQLASGDTSGEVQKTSDAIASTIQALERQAATMGMGEYAAQRYTLAMDGATKTQLEAFDAAWDVIAAYETQEAAILAQTRVWEEGRRVAESLRTPLEVYQDDLLELRHLLDAGAISQETFNRGLTAAGERLDEASEKTKQTTEDLSEFWKQAFRNMETFAGDFFFDALQGRMEDLGDKFKATIDRMVADFLSAQLLQGLFGPQGGGNAEVGGLLGKVGGAVAAYFSGGSSLGGGAAAGATGLSTGAVANASGVVWGMATGGDVSRGRAYKVGENGPELFVPDADGEILNASRFRTLSGAVGEGGGSSLSVRNTWNVVTPDAQSFQAPAARAQIDRRLALSVRRAQTRAT